MQFDTEMNICIFKIPKISWVKQCMCFKVYICVGILVLAFAG